MKLTKEQVDKITILVLEGLKKKDLVVFKADETKVIEKITDAITTDLAQEDKLDREVEEILKSHSSDFNSQKIDYRRMFNLVKHKLAKERGIVL